MKTIWHFEVVSLAFSEIFTQQILCIFFFIRPTTTKIGADSLEGNEAATGGVITSSD